MYVVYTEKGIQKHYRLSDKKMVIFGREEHVDFQIAKDSMISREHFGIQKDENGNFTIIDLGSSNGTFLNDKKLESNSVNPLKNNDKIRAGRINFSFRTSIARKNTTELVNQVAVEYEKGRGFKTMMCEILGEDKNKLRK